MKALKLSGFVGLFVLGASAHSQVSQISTASGPYLESGNILRAVADGNIWSSVVGIKFYAKLIVNGVVRWTNDPKGVAIPVGGWPGLAFNYWPAVTLASGTHTVTWQGYWYPVAAGNDNTVWSFTSTLVVP